MLRHIDIHPFLESRKEFVKMRQAEMEDETALDRIIIMKIGLVSTIICFLLQLCAVIFGTVFYDQQQKIVLSVLGLLLFPCFKYIFGGFGGNGGTFNSIKLLLGLFAVWVYSKLPDFYNFAFDWFNDSLLSKIEVWAFLVLSGLMLGISLATYVKAIGLSSLSYNRFVAGFNAGAAIAFSILLLICSNRDKIVHSTNYTAKTTTVDLVSPVEEAVEVVDVMVESKRQPEVIDTVKINIQDGNVIDDEQLIRTVFDKFVFSYSNEDPHDYFGSKALRQLEEAYEYDGEGYGFWDLNLDLAEEDPRVNEMSDEFGVYLITSIEKEESGWYKVFFKVSGISGYNKLRVLNGKVEEYEPGKIIQ